MTPPKLILVTDPAYDDDAIVRVIEAAAPACAPGALAVQLRDKVRPREDVARFAARLREVTRACGAALVVNGNPELAHAVGADGVHLGGGAVSIARARRVCGGEAWISIAAHSDDAVRAAVAQGANGALVSPIFPTTSGSGASYAAKSEIRVRVKPLAPPKVPRGLEALASARAVVTKMGSNVALYALGGVGPENARSCVEAGADGVAVIRALLASADPFFAAKALCAATSA